MACTVTSITPNFGAVGDSITVAGTGFGASQGVSTITVAGTTATVTSWSDTAIVITIPSISTGGRVVVTVSGAVQTSYSASWFELRDSTCLSIYDTINGRLKAQDETSDSSPEDYRYADARDYNNLTHLIANLLEGPGKPSMSGLRCRYSSATAIIVEAGAALSSTGKHLITLAAETTLPLTTVASAGVPGLDEQTLAATATTSGASASVTLSASFWSEAAIVATARTLTGTFSTVGTAGTVSGGKLISGNGGIGEAAIGDLLHTATKGASRISAIAADGSFTLAAALPGGDATNEACTLNENVTIQPNTAVAADKFRVKTVSHDGLTVVMSAAISSGAGSGKTAKIGVEIASLWVHGFLRYGTSGTIPAWSTQRTTPYPLTGHATAFRRLGGYYNYSTGDLCSIDIVGGPQRIGMWLKGEAEARFLTAGAATTKTILEAACPPTAHFLWFNGIQNSNSGIMYWARVMAVDQTDGQIVVPLYYFAAAAGSRRIRAGLIAYANDNASAALYLDGSAWLENV